MIRHIGFALPPFVCSGLLSFTWPFNFSISKLILVVSIALGLPPFVCSGLLSFTCCTYFHRLDAGTEYFSWSSLDVCLPERNSLASHLFSSSVNFLFRRSNNVEPQGHGKATIASSTAEGTSLAWPRFLFFPCLLPASSFLGERFD